MLENKNQHCIKRIIYDDQVGFTPAMQGWFNTQKSINVIHYINKLKRKTTLLYSKKTNNPIQK